VEVDPGERREEDEQKVVTENQKALHSREGCNDLYRPDELLGTLNASEKDFEKTGPGLGRRDREDRRGFQSESISGLTWKGGQREKKEKGR